MKKIAFFIISLCIMVNSANLKVEELINIILKDKDDYNTLLELRFSESFYKREQAFVSVFKGNTTNIDYYNFLRDYLLYFGYYNYRGNKPVSNQQLFDSLYIVTIAKFLSIDHNDFVNIRREAIKHLTFDTPFDQLYALTDSIKPYIIAYPDCGEKYYLLSHLRLSNEEKNKIRNYKEEWCIPLAVKARLGDSEVEKNLIDRYIKAKEYREKESMVSELIMAGTENCLKNLILHFNQPVFDEMGTKMDPCTRESIRYPIIKGFRRYFPYSSLFREELAKVDTLRIPPPEVVIPYLEKFKEWAYDTYKVKPVDPDPKPIMFGFCKVR